MALCKYSCEDLSEKLKQQHFSQNVINSYTNSTLTVNLMNKEYGGEQRLILTKMVLSTNTVLSKHLQLHGTSVEHNDN